ncbi:MAG: hypothetical protein ACWA5R_07910 [bacterium]
MNIHLFSVVLLILSSASSATNSDLLGESQFYTYHNNIWINLHHFLYEKASGKQAKKLAEDHLSFVDIGDSNAIQSLSQLQKNQLQSVVAFYKQKVIRKPLLQSAKVLKWLQNQVDESANHKSEPVEGMANQLNLIMPTYKEVFWPRHKVQNEILFTKHQSLIAKTEASVIGKMQVLSGLKWKGKVRVDLSTYGNWASAYSPADDNIVVSTIDPSMESTLFIEFVFHESSHLLFGRRSPFRKALFKEKKRNQIKAPRQLWHAAMFYLSGMTTQQTLNKFNVEHKLIMKQKRVFFDYYNNAQFKKTLNDYYSEKIDREQVASQLLRLYKKDSTE